MFGDLTMKSISLNISGSYGYVDNLHIAAQSGNLKLVDQLLHTNVNVNVKDYDNVTPLSLATERNHFEVVDRLLRVKGIDVNAIDNEHTTALHHASQNGELRIVKLLLKHGARINAKQNEGFTPLHKAIQHKRIEVSKFLIQSGADINITDDLKWTPLHNATYNGLSLQIVEDLVKKGACINAKTLDGRTAIHFVAEFNFCNIAKYLIDQGANVNVVNNMMWTALHCAAYDGNIHMVKLLLEKKVDIDAKTIKCTTPLHFAVTHNHEKVVEILLEKGANINSVDHTNWSSLHFAAQNGNNKILECLLKHGADVNIKDTQQNGTALHLAAQYAHFDTVKTLILHGAKVNEEIDGGATTLHLAALCKDSQIVSLLLESGAYYDAKTQRGLLVLPSQYALLSQSLANVRPIKLIEKLFDQINFNNCLGVEDCIKKGAIIDCRSVDFESPLLYASMKGYTNIVNCLLGHNANVNISNEDNFTSLHYAAKLNHLEIAYALLKHGATFNAKTKTALKTPLDFAKDPNTVSFLQVLSKLFEDAKSGCSDVVKHIVAIKDKSLKEFDAVTQARNIHGHTIMQVALVNNHKDIANLISKELLK